MLKTTKKDNISIGNDLHSSLEIISPAIREKRAFLFGPRRKENWWLRMDTVGLHNKLITILYVFYSQFR